MDAPPRRMLRFRARIESDEISELPRRLATRCDDLACDSLTFPRSVLEFCPQTTRRNRSKCLNNDRRHLGPVDTASWWWLEHDAQPTRECATPRRQRAEEALRICLRQFFSRTGWGGAPDSHPIVATVMVVEVADWSLAARKEARGAVTDEFGHTGKSQCDQPNPVGYVDTFHETSVADRASLRERRPVKRSSAMHRASPGRCRRIPALADSP